MTMNWNPLRKLSLIARPELDSNTQSANETLDKLIAEFDSAENVTKALYQAVKKLPDHILCTGKFETKLTDDLSSSNIFQDNEIMRNVIEDWHSFAYITNAIGDEYVITLQKTSIEPLKQLKQAFADLRASIRWHDTLQFEVVKLQRKVASYNDKEKTGANLVKLQECKQTLANTQNEFARRTQILVNDLSKFLAGSVEMLRPLLEGFIAAEVAWIRACKRTMDNKKNLMNATTAGSSMMANPGDAIDSNPHQSEHLRKVEESFKSLSLLTITSPDANVK